MILRSGNKM